MQSFDDTSGSRTGRTSIPLAEDDVDPACGPRRERTAAAPLLTEPDAPDAPDGEAFYRLFLERAPLGVVSVDAAGRFLYANPQYERITGYSRRELSALALADITHPDDLPENLRLLEELARGARDGYTLEKRYRRKDGAWIWVRLTASGIRDGAGALRYTTTLVEDVTEQRRVSSDIRS